MFREYTYLFVVSSQTGVESLAVKVPKYLCIYYGYPSAVQYSYGNVTRAISWFSQFDLIVFGGALVTVPNHPDYNNTVNITKSLVAKGKRVFGYVDLGVNGSTYNYTYTQMQQYVNTWIQVGVTVCTLSKHEKT